MPAEWELHAATWLAWPHYTLDWPGKFGAIPWAFAEIVRAIARSERVRLIVLAARHEARARRALTQAGAPLERVDFLRVPTDRGWLRDMGPIFLVRDEKGPRELAATSWRFNGWAKYPNWRRDDAAKDRLLKRLGVRTGQPEAAGRRVVLEGGAIDGDGRGTVLTTEACLLHPNRGPGRTKERMEQLLADQLRARRVLWLGHGIDGDDTDGHVDDIARFVSPGVVVVAVCEDASDPNHMPLSENLRRLRQMRDARDTALTVVPLPMPPRLECAGQRSPASHANFYLANGVALVPTFGGASDETALAILRELLSGRDIVGIPCADLVSGFGALHCVTQQEPAES
jgi:agmatine deiminase